VYNVTYAIPTNFDIYFRNSTYRTFYVSTNSCVSFQNISWDSIFKVPIIMIDANSNVAINLTVKSTADNITIYYRGYN
jgi:hypothetical protein